MSIKMQVLSIPRSGSVWLSRALYHWLKQDAIFATYVSEPFNPLHHGLWYEDLPEGGRKNHNQPGPGRYHWKYRNDVYGELIQTQDDSPYPDLDTWIAIRLETLRHTRSNLVLHNHLLPIPVSVLSYLQSCNETIISLRKDELRQFLSYGHAYCTRKWFNLKTPDSKAIVPNSLTFPLDVATNFARRLSDSRELARSMGSKVSYYEDRDFNDPVGTISRIIGRSPSRQTVEAEWLPEVQHPFKNMLQNFTNQAELLEIAEEFNLRTG